MPTKDSNLSSLAARRMKMYSLHHKIESMVVKPFNNGIAMNRDVGFRDYELPMPFGWTDYKINLDALFVRDEESCRP